MVSVDNALTIAVLVVGILLLSCWNSSKPSEAKGAAEGFKVETAADVQEYEKEASEFNTSKFGSGKVNRELAAQNNDLTGLESYEDYSEVVQYQSLEPEVYESHDSYAFDIGVANSGASVHAIRSDPCDVNPFVGLRRPNYHDTYSGADVRTDHSEYPDQMTAATHYLL